jgi:hypothetical protein
MTLCGSVGIGSLLGLAMVKDLHPEQAIDTLVGGGHHLLGALLPDGMQEVRGSNPLGSTRADARQRVAERPARGAFCVAGPSWGRGAPRGSRLVLRGCCFGEGSSGLRPST